MRCLCGLIIYILLISLGSSDRDFRPWLNEVVPKGLKTKTEKRYKHVRKMDEYQKVLESTIIYRYDKTRHCKASHGHFTDEFLNSLTRKSLPSKEWKSTYEYKYDDKGNLTERRIYGADSKLRRRESFKYDEKGNMIESNLFSPGSKSISKHCKWLRKYDDKGNCVESATYYSGELHFKSIYKYDNKGNKVESIRYQYYGAKSSISKTIYQYDDKGNNIELVQYNAEGEVIVKKIYGYDSRGNETGWADYSPSKGLTSLQINKYDDKGNTIEKLQYFKNTLSVKWTYKYDDKGNLIEETYYEFKHEDGADIETPKEQTVYEYEFYPEPSDSGE